MPGTVTALYAEDGIVCADCGEELISIQDLRAEAKRLSAELDECAQGLSKAVAANDTANRIHYGRLLLKLSVEIQNLEHRTEAASAQ
jgi:hypothetical protein